MIDWEKRDGWETQRDSWFQINREEKIPLQLHGEWMWARQEGRCQRRRFQAYRCEENHTSNAFTWMDRKGCLRGFVWSKSIRCKRNWGLKNFSMLQKENEWQLLLSKSTQREGHWVRCYFVHTHVLSLARSLPLKSWVCLLRCLLLTSHLCLDGQFGTLSIRFINCFFNKLRRHELEWIDMDTHKQCLSHK